MYCLLVLRKMPFTIHFIFTPLTGKIFWPLFTTFCSCFDMIVLKNHSFFVLSTWYRTWCLMNFFLLITLFSHALQFRAHLNCLPHFMNLSMLNIILNIFHMNSLFKFVRWPLRFTSSSHSLQVWYSDHFSLHYIPVFSFLKKITCTWYCFRCFLSFSMLYHTLCMLLPWCFVKFLLAFYAYTWCLLIFCGCVQSNFALKSNQIILMETLFQLFSTHL